MCEILGQIDDKICDDITCEDLHLASVAGMDDLTCEKLNQICVRQWDGLTI